ncbi:MAG: histidine phosphatase family protein [Myxococcota bacterium]|nr:histidine phosphatase family protein [Myxococcota bacterium]
MELLLIRHGLPIRLEKNDGTPADPPLAEMGKRQAEAVAQWLEGERQIDRIYSSPLQRARETALPLSEKAGLAIELEPRVSEYDRDSSTYIPIEELKEIDYEAWQEFMKRGYPPGMDLTDFYQEVITSLQEIVVENPGRRVAVFCHGGVINAWASFILDFEFKLFFNPTYTSINRFYVSKEGIRSVGSLNEAGHLRELEG